MAIEHKKKPLAKKRAPDGLSDRARIAWNRITSTYVLSSDAILVLSGALQSYDDYVAAREMVKAQGMVGKDGKRHPAVDIYNAAWRNFLAGFRYLGLDADAELDTE